MAVGPDPHHQTFDRVSATSTMTSLVRLCVMGDGGCGKTASTIQMCHNHFVEAYDPTIEDSYRRNVAVQGETVLLEILDTAGQEEFSPLRDQWIRESEGFLLIYDVTSRASLDCLELMLNQIVRTKQEDEPDIMSRVVVAGNKIDKPGRVVSEAEAQAWGKEHGVAAVVQFSAKTREGLVETFEQLIVKVGTHKGIFGNNKASKTGKKSAPNAKKLSQACNVL
jgi:GTPase KRas protein